MFVVKNSVVSYVRFMNLMAFTCCSYGAIIQTIHTFITHSVVPEIAVFREMVVLGRQRVCVNHLKSQLSVTACSYRNDSQHVDISGQNPP